MGLEGFSTYKYKLYGNGHIVAEYASGLKQFKHRAIEQSRFYFSNHNAVRLANRDRITDLEVRRF